ncbi:M48 family metallopeptidase [Staphylococcus intermedius]|uniref:Peptidase, M48 family n=1 Tax=Staphylococcus intermedius NCTC 11048 TaxID=1141106 RepID=A0A380GA05_STAIN|nr:M48 family metalloprotease [Staphylococcus intermedius]PCF65321.1 peptidase M48 [Staphylococcus intermedius]PCF80999.1 peptidase M48 [Staphylococcus intermedius]PCF82281.1 peptidase M48 [Staphylococcus intermedius]PCF86981.1 peptidase M48 [Staphylococcus intermedius]PCF87542.1 peptidase M48 [Staphylococcus intermedius]
MRILAILIYLLVVLIRLNIVKAPYLDENTKSLIFIFMTLLVPTFIIRPIFNKSTKNLVPLNYKELEASVALPKGTKMYTKASLLIKGMYVKGNRSKSSIVIHPELIEKVPIDELRFLIYHEVCHIKNNDITKNQLFRALSYGVLPILLVFISGFIEFTSMNLFIAYIVLAVIIYLSGILLYFLRIRHRELTCDSYASYHTSRETGIRSLLTLKKLGVLKDTKLVLFASHPNLDKRIQNLENS